MTSKPKRKAGDLWGLVCIDTNTGEEKRVQIGYWPSSTFAYAKQAQEYADFYNENAKKNGHPKRYEIRYAGNYKEDIFAGLWV